jgi:uncharacterized protein YodC (DUF2158 family)
MNIKTINTERTRMSDEKQFKSGDLVQLRGGGPRMTVSFYTVGDQVQCKWFVGETLTKAEFSEGELEIAGGVYGS